MWTEDDSEKVLDRLASAFREAIAGCNPKTATFLRLLKETGARLGEAWQLGWIDIDFETKTVNIAPEKGSNPRKLKISDKLISMLNSPQETTSKCSKVPRDALYEVLDDNGKE